MLLLAAVWPATAQAADGDMAGRRGPAVHGERLPVEMAPPLDTPMTYTIVQRRLSRTGDAIEFRLDYRLLWQKMGRGFRLESTLLSIRSDAPPAIERVMGGMMRPLLDRPVSFLIDSKGTEVVQHDSDTFWAAAVRDVERWHDEPVRREAAELARLLTALPPAQRDAVMTADVRAILPAMVPELRSAQPVAAAGTPQLSYRYRRDDVVGAAAPGMRVARETLWSIDRATGLVTSATEQTWSREAGDDTSLLIEERVRSLHW